MKVIHAWGKKKKKKITQNKYIYIKSKTSRARGDSIPVLSPTQYAKSNAKSLQSCPTLCNPIDGSPPGSAVPGILQARILEWVAISFSNA